MSGAIDPKLLADILARPLDDAPRLVAADALQEKGDPRGLFIAHQVRLAESGLPKVERATLYLESQALLKRHADEWGASVKGLVHRMRRGFVDQVTADAGELIKRGASLFQAEPITSLVVQSAAPDKIEALTKLGAFQRVQSLTIHGALGDKGAAALATALAARTEPLTSLNVGSTKIRGAGAKALVRSIAGMKKLVLTSNEVGDEGCDAIASAKESSSLSVLFLTDNDITDEGVLKLARSPNLGSLTRLGLARNEEVTTDSLARIASAKTLRGLRWLEYSDEDELQHVAVR